MEITAYIPGEGVRYKSTPWCSSARRVKDLPGCALSHHPRKLDATGVDRKQGRSKYGAKTPKS